MDLKLRHILILLFSPVVFAQQAVEPLGNLNDLVLETSGLIFYNDHLITHNDSGNTPQLFEIDSTTVEITRTVTITNAQNTDWEDLAQDDDYIYIADFGNTPGTRQDLAIYKVAKTDYSNSVEVIAEVIAFSYEDQTDFTGGQNSDWDAEALVVFKDQLLIFTKQWQTNGTVVYSLPKTPGVHSAQRIGGFPTQGLITGGTYNEISNTLYLCGYSQQLQPFLIRKADVGEDFEIDGSEERVSLGLTFAQVEAITHVSENRYFLSSERFVNTSPPITLNAALFAFSNSDVEVENPGGEEPGGEEPGEGENPEPEVQGLLIYRTFGSRLLEYDLNMDQEVFGRAIFDSSGRRIQFTHGSQIDSNSIDLSTLGSAVYYLTFYLQGETISKPFILD